ncbi:LuxR C-terminal-related transcriptional regulator [Stutzerimonas stutzeri]
MRSPHPKTAFDLQEPIQVFLIGSKLLPPAETSNLIPRPRLIKRLGEAGNAVLALVQAPPGYGKTCVLAQHYHWLQQHGQRVTWLSLDSSAQELPVFVAHLKGAIELAGVEGLAHEQFTRVGESGLHRAFNSILGVTQAQSGTPLYVFLDDVHHLAGTDSVRVLSMLIDHAPPGLHFILSFRGEPCLSVARQRMHGQVHDLGTSDLCFSHGETALLMEKHGVAGLDQAQLDTLEARLEGWAGGLRLAAMLLQRDPELLHNLANFSGERRQFADFFLQDVLGRQPENIRRFLQYSAVLDRLCVPLCNALTQSQDGQDMLRECEARGLFLLPMDEEQKWYRYHPLFAEFLRRQLRESDPTLFEGLHRRASDWLSDHQLHAQAFKHALASRDLLRAAEIMDANCEQIFSIDENAVNLVEKLPDELLARFPRILLAKTWNLLMGWQFETCRQLLVSARQSIERLEQAGQASEMEIRNLNHQMMHREMMLAMLADQMPEVEEQARTLVDEYDDAHPLVRASLYTALIYTRREHYKLGDIERLHTQAQEHLNRANSPLGMVFHQAVLGPSRFVAGRVHVALQSLNDTLKSAERIAGKGSPLAAVVAMHLAKIHYERDELALSRKILEQYLPQISYKGFVDQAIAGWLTRARLSMIDGDVATAFRMLDEADVFAQEHSFERLRLFALAERLKWLLRQGDTDAVVRLGRKHDLRRPANQFTPRHGITTRDEARALTWVRVAQAEDRLPEALNLAKQWHRHMSAADAIRSVLRWDLIIAHLSLLSGDQRAALRIVRRAMFQAAPGGFIRVFLDEGAWLHGLLREQLQAAGLEGEPTDAFATELLRRFQGDDGIAAKPTLPAVEPVAIAGSLNSRELDILKMVAAGMLNREIGDKLGMTEGSVKWYLQQIYDKIGIRRRSQAAERARQLGILR